MQPTHLLLASAAAIAATAVETTPTRVSMGDGTPVPFDTGHKVAMTRLYKPAQRQRLTKPKREDASTKKRNKQAKTARKINRRNRR